MDFEEFQKISRTTLGNGQLTSSWDIRYYSNLNLLKLLADASNKAEGGIRRLHVFAAMDLRERMEREAAEDCAWEIAEIFRKIYSKYQKAHPYAHLDCAEWGNGASPITDAQRLYLESRAALLRIYKEGKKELDSIDNAMAPFCLREHVYGKKDILAAAEIIKGHLSRGRFSGGNLERAKKILFSPSLENEDEEIVCAKAELIAIVEKTGAAQQITRMLNGREDTLSPSARRKLKGIIGQCSGERGAGPLPPKFAKGKHLQDGTTTRRSLHVHSRPPEPAATNAKELLTAPSVKKT